MKKLLPITLCVEGRRAVVVGGGEVGARKVRSLAQCGASVLWITGGSSPPAGPGVSVLSRRYQPSDVAGAALVFACTDDAAVNTRIAADARKAGALVNAVDQPKDCDFYMPAVVQDGDVLLAISTGAQAPALAKALKALLAAALPEGVGDFAGALATLRDELRQASAQPQVRTEVAKALARLENLPAFRQGGIEALRSIMSRLLETAGKGDSPQ